MKLRNPFRKPPSRLEVLQEALRGTVETLHDKLEAPLEKLKDVTGSAVGTVAATAAHGWEVASHKAGDVLQAAPHAASAIASHTAGAASQVAGSAAQVAGAAKEKGGDVAHSVAEKLSGATNVVGHTAHTARDAVVGTVGSVAHAAGAKAVGAGHAVAGAGQAVTGAVSGAAHGAADTVRGTTSSALSAAGGTLGAVGTTLGGLRESVSHRLHGTTDSAANDVMDAAAQTQDDVVEAANDAAEYSLDSFEQVAEAHAELSGRAARKAEKAARKAEKSKEQAEEKADDTRIAARDFADDYQTEVHISEGPSKWLWIALGVVIGVVVGLMLAPTTGRRSRALVKDKLNKAGHEAADLGQAATGKAADLGRRAAGAVHEMKTSSAEDFADDITIADRVRTELGENAATRNLERLNVDCADGIVTVRGPMADSELQAQIEAVVRAVKGVREVRMNLLTDDTDEDAETFVG